MSADLNKLQDDIEQDAKETPPAHELFGELSQRAREATSATAFLRGAFRRIVERYRAPYGTVQQRFGAEVFEDNWHAGAVDPAFWKDAVNSLQTETLATGQSLARVYRAKDRHATVALVSVPISGTSGSGAMAAVVHCRDEHVASLMLGEFRALAGVLGALPEWRDPGELGVLRRYARERAEEPLIMQYTTHALNRLFNHRNPVVSTMRNLGLNFTNALPVVRNALIRYAAQGHF